MPQRATIESIPEAFTMLKQMRGQEVEWGEDYREAGALALKAVLEQGMAARIDRHLEEMAERGEADRRLNNEWPCEPPMPSNADSAKFVDSGHEGRWAESMVTEGTLAAPEWVLVEASNILRRLERSGEISRLEANSAHRDLLRLDLELFPFAPFAERVWALRSNLTAYDAWYVALAEALDCALATLDRKLGRATGPVCEIVVPSHAR